MKSKIGLCGSGRRRKVRATVEPAAADTAVASSNYAAIISRKGEIEDIRDCVRRRKSLHLHGSAGVGKSALLDHLNQHWEKIGVSCIPIYCKSSVTLREILVCIAEELLVRSGTFVGTNKYFIPLEIRSSSDIRANNNRDLRNVVLRRVEQGDFCIILDHLERVTPKIDAFLSALHERACVITASRQSWDLMDYSFIGRLAYGLWLISKLKINNLKRKDAFNLMECLHKHLNTKLPDKENIFTEIFHITQGNPKMIHDILDKARKPDYIVDGKLKLNLIVIDCRIDAVRIT